MRTGESKVINTIYSYKCMHSLAIVGQAIVGACKVILVKSSL